MLLIILGSIFYLWLIFLSQKPVILFGFGCVALLYFWIFYWALPKRIWKQYIALFA